MKLEPLGYKMLVLPVDEENWKTESGLEVVPEDVTVGRVVEVTAELKEAYKTGDKILFSKGAGNGILYNGQPHLFLDGRGAPMGDVWAKIK